MVNTMRTYIFKNKLDKIITFNTGLTKISSRPLRAETGCSYHR